MAALAGIGTLRALRLRAFAGTATGPGRVRIVNVVKAQGSAIAEPQGPVRIGEFNMVGQYDIDQLLEPPMQRLLDNMAASPAAFAKVRFFHALDSGTPARSIADDALDAGLVWPEAGGPMDFSRTFAALETLTARGLQPFVGLNFFSAAVSNHAATPPPPTALLARVAAAGPGVLGGAGARAPLWSRGDPQLAI